MDHNEYIKRMIKHFSSSNNPKLYKKEYLGCTIQKMKKGKEIEEESSGGEEENKDFEWSAISNMMRSGGFIAKLKM
jgi:hypothetical protein